MKRIFLIASTALAALSAVAITYVAGQALSLIPKAIAALVGG